MLGRILMIAYFVIGIFVAADHNYFKNINDILDVLSAIIAVVLWPLPALGVNVRIGHVAKEIDKNALSLIAGSIR